MRIAQVGTLNFRVPPRLYGGIERVVSYLTEELVAQGHEVTLFASDDSETNAKLVGVCRQLHNVESAEERRRHYDRMMHLVFEDVSRYDVIHFHTESLQLRWLRSQPYPNLTTLHSLLHGPRLKPLFDEYNPPLVSISDNQRLPIGKANWQATIHHGLPRDLYTFRKTPGDYLAFIGRPSHVKRLDRAVRIARRAHMKLKVAARIDPHEEHFKKDIEPLLENARDSVEFVGEVGGNEKDEFLGKAYALLFPIDWPEPFGLVMIESLACGTPVIAWRNGSVPEVIDDGSTGFIVDSLEEAVQAVGRISTLKRKTCRQVFEKRFDAARMVRQYVEVYRRLADAER